MAETKSSNDILQPVIADISVMISPLPDPSDEPIASIVLQAQARYLENKVAELGAEIQMLRQENSALCEENSILRFENDMLLNEKGTPVEGANNTTSKGEANARFIVESDSPDLISLYSDASPLRDITKHDSNLGNDRDTTT